MTRRQPEVLDHACDTDKERAMGIRSWFRRERKDMDAEAVTRAKDELRDASTDEREREVMRGDVEGLAADSRAGAPFGEVGDGDFR
jgi:hypothetical protein